MPLQGFLHSGKNDRGRIASINNTDIKERRKKILPIKGRSNWTLNSLYVLDCVSHEPRGAVVPVDLIQYEEGQGWVSLGTAKCCPLCWMIIVPPADSDLPEPSPLPVVEVSQKQKEALRMGRRKKRGRIEKDSPTDERRRLIRERILAGEEFSVYDIMEWTGVQRQAALRDIATFVHLKKIVKVATGVGRGNRTLYKKAP